MILVLSITGMTIGIGGTSSDFGAQHNDGFADFSEKSDCYIEKGEKYEKQRTKQKEYHINQA